MIENIGYMLNTTIYDATSCLVQIQGVSEAEALLPAGILAIFLLIMLVTWAVMYKDYVRMSRYLEKKKLLDDYQAFKRDREIIE